jgi:hypothetical protein
MALNLEQNNLIPSNNILQWNCRSAISNKIDIELLLLQYNIRIAALSESWLPPGDDSFNISNYECIRDDRADGRGGAALLIHSSILEYKFPSIPLQSKLLLFKLMIGQLCPCIFHHPQHSIYLSGMVL